MSKALRSGDTARPIVMSKSPHREVENAAPEPGDRESATIATAATDRSRPVAPGAADAAASEGGDDLTEEDLAVIGLRPKRRSARTRKTMWLALLAVPIVVLLFMGRRFWNSPSPEPAPDAPVAPNGPPTHERTSTPRAVPTRGESAVSIEEKTEAASKIAQTTNPSIASTAARPRRRAALEPSVSSIQSDSPARAPGGPAVARYPDLAPQILDQLVRQSEAKHQPGAR